MEIASVINPAMTGWQVVVLPTPLQVVTGDFVGAYVPNAPSAWGIANVFDSPQVQGYYVIFNNDLSPGNEASQPLIGVCGLVVDLGAGVCMRKSVVRLVR